MRDIERERVFTEVIGSLFNARGSEQCKMMVCLCKLFITETREFNDNAQEREIAKNQGKIEAYKSIIEVITEGIPSR